MSRSIVPGIAANESFAALIADDLDDPAPVALAVELDEEHTLPRAEAELAVANRDRLARRAEQHRHAVRVPVADVHVLRADVLGAPVPVVVRVVVALGRDEPAEQRGEVLEKAALELIDADAAGRLSRVAARDAGTDAALLHRSRDVVGDVEHGESAGGAEAPLLLEHLHRAIVPSAPAARSGNRRRRYAVERGPVAQLVRAADS